MTQFHYRGIDRSGVSVAGVWEAASPAAARLALIESGLTDVEVLPTDVVVAPLLAEGSPARAIPLGESDFISLLGLVEEATTAGLPLPTALRLLSDELPNRRQRDALRSMSDRLAGGELLEDLLPQYQTGLPTAIGELAAAGAGGDRLPLVLGEYLQRLQQTIEIRRLAWLSLIYPAFLLSIALGVSVIFAWWVGPELQMAYTELNDLRDSFSMTPSGVQEVAEPIGGLGLQFLAGLRLILSPLAGGVLLAVLALIGMARLAGGRKFWSFVDYSIPLIGPLFRYARLSQFCHLCALLLECRLPLPRALRVAGAAVDCPPVAAGTEALAAGIEAGKSATDVARTAVFVPEDLIPLMRWIDHPDELAGMLRATGEIFAARVRLQATKLAMVLQPLVLLAVAFFFGLLVVILYAPFFSTIKLLNDLS